MLKFMPPFPRIYVRLCNRSGAVDKLFQRLLKKSRDVYDSLLLYTTGLSFDFLNDHRTRVLGVC